MACDVQYEAGNGYGAGILFNDWQSEKATEIVRAAVESVAQYKPGEFYRREMPCLLALLQNSTTKPDLLLIDGYVWLMGGKPALGARLYEAIDGRIPIVGIGKSRLRIAGECVEVIRRGRTQPLFVSAVGMSAQEASDRIREMHGKKRIPTILELADQEARCYAKQAQNG